MLWQLGLGSVLIVASIILQSSIMALALATFRRQEKRLRKAPFIPRTIILISSMTVLIVIGISLSTWLWAYSFFHLGIFAELEESVYFSAICFTTLGFGDIILEKQWRLLSGICAANGLILFGLSTAFMVDFMREFARLKIKKKKNS